MVIQLLYTASFSIAIVAGNTASNAPFPHDVPVSSNALRHEEELHHFHESNYPDSLLSFPASRKLQDTAADPAPDPATPSTTENGIPDSESASEIEGTDPASHNDQSNVYIENENEIQHASLTHSKLSTILNGTVEAAGGVIFSVENKREDNQNVILSGLGLNVKTAGEMPSPCRVKVYTKLNGTDADTPYRLAVDTSEVMCMGSSIETLIPASLFLKHFREVTMGQKSQLNIESDAFESDNSHGRFLTRKRGHNQNDATSSYGFVKQSNFNESEVSGDSNNSFVENNFDASGTNGTQNANGTVHPGEKEFDNTYGNEIDGITDNDLATSPLSLSEFEQNYPLIIPPNSILSMYIVVMSEKTSKVQFTDKSPKILSSAVSDVMDSQTSDSSLTIYEASSYDNSFMFDFVTNGGKEQQPNTPVEPTSFNGALYYDILGSNSSITEYFDELEYSMLPGDALHGLPGCDKSLSTGYVDTIGSYGIMFDVTSLASEEDSGPDFTKDIVIYGMDVYIRNIVNASIEVRVRNDGNSDRYVSYADPVGQTLIAQNWEVVARGTIEGKGADVGSPIPPEAWLKDVVIPYGQSVGFYITLKEAPDLRYRSSEVAEGEIYMSDGILGIGAGRVWGQYPLKGDGSDEYFGPREFSGEFKYHAHEGLCDSPAPSAAPSSFVSEGPPGCQTSSSLTTTFHDSTGSYGSVFDVVAKTDLNVTGIDLSIDWHSGNSTDVLVYAKRGSWVGFQQDHGSWPHLLVNTTIYMPENFPKDNLGSGNSNIEWKMISGIIPDSAFTPLSMASGETWSFFVGISNADLRYSEGSSIGNTISSNSELEVLEGAGAADFPPLPKQLDEGYTFYAPRVFNGNLKYDHISDCPSQAPSGMITLSPTVATSMHTSATYTFYVEHNADKMNSITEDIGSAVKGIVEGFLKDETTLLYGHAIKDGLIVTSVVANVASPSDVRYVCIPTPPYVCTPLSVVVEVWHLSSASSDDVSFALLSEATTVPALINVEGYTVEYVGELAVETNSEITLSGVPPQEMEEDEADFFEGICLHFLHGQVLHSSPADVGLNVLSVTLNDQEISQETQSEDIMKGSIRRQLSRRLKNVNKVKVSVKGTYRPPPDIDFGQIVEDSINANPGQLTEKLSSPGAIGNSSYFDEVEVIGAREIKEVEEQPVVELIQVQSTEDTSTKFLFQLAAMVFGGLIALLSVAFFLRPHRRAVLFRKKSQDFTYLNETQQLEYSDSNFMPPR